jgi:hypothetical protein
MRELTRRQRNPIEEGTENEYFYQWQILMPSQKKSKRGASQFLSKHQKDRAESYFERYYRNGSSPWFRETKMNRRAFVSINRAGAGHSSLKATLSIFNAVSTAERECGDELQTEEHIVTCYATEDAVQICNWDLLQFHS